ncbi:MAG: hypothetical protein ACK4IK_02165 [Bacteroidia bacterium]
MALPEKIDLSVYKNQQDFLLKTIEQLEKDFSSEGLSIQIKKSNISYKNIIHQALPIIENLLNNDIIKLQQLIYRIDLPEKAYSDIIKKSPEPASELTQLIIQRELLKVVIRHYYSSK